MKLSQTVSEFFDWFLAYTSFFRGSQSNYVFILVSTGNQTFSAYDFYFPDYQEQVLYYGNFERVERSLQVSVNLDYIKGQYTSQIRHVNEYPFRTKPRVVQVSNLLTINKRCNIPFSSFLLDGNLAITNTLTFTDNELYTSAHRNELVFNELAFVYSPQDFTFYLLLSPYIPVTTNETKVPCPIASSLSFSCYWFKVCETILLQSLTSILVEYQETFKQLIFDNVATIVALVQELFDSFFKVKFPQYKVGILALPSIPQLLQYQSQMGSNLTPFQWSLQFAIAYRPDRGFQIFDENFGQIFKSVNFSETSDISSVFADYFSTLVVT